MRTMKKIVVAVCAMALSVSIVSCKKDSNGNDFTVKATISTSDDGSKTSIGGLADGQYPVLWSAGDQIVVFPTSGNSSTLKLRSGENTQSGVFSGASFEGGAPYLAAYPATAQCEDGVISIDLSSDFQAGPMAAYSTNESEFAFQTLMTWVSFGFHGNATINKVVCVDANLPLNSGVLTAEWNGNGFTTSISGGETTVELQCAEPIALNESTFSYVPAFIVPKGALANFTLKLYDVNGNQIGSDIIKNIEGGLQAGKNYSINIQEMINADPEVDHTKNPLLKWAESDLMMTEGTSGRTAESEFTGNYRTTGDYYQFGRNQGYMNVNYAAQYYAVEMSDAASNRNAYPGTGSTTPCTKYYANSITFSSYPHYFFIDNNHEGDYKTPSRQEDWYTRAGSNGYNYANPCPEGWHIPTAAEYCEILPYLNGSYGNNNWNTLVQIKTLEDGTRCAFRWSKTSGTNNSYLTIDCLVVAANVTEESVNWSDEHVVSRSFKGAGYIQAHRNLWQWGSSYQYTARPLKWGMYRGEVSGQVVIVTQSADYMNYGGLYWTSDKEQRVMTFVFNNTTGYNLGYYLCTYDRPIAANIRCVKD